MVALVGEKPYGKRWNAIMYSIDRACPPPSVATEQDLIARTHAFINHLSSCGFDIQETKEVDPFSEVVPLEAKKCLTVEELANMDFGGMGMHGKEE